MKTVWKIVSITVLVVAVAYFAACVIGNFVTGHNTTPPDVARAAYAVQMKATGNVVLTDQYERVGTAYVLHGYWELMGKKWAYRPQTIRLDERTFGPITVMRRQGG